MRYTPFVPRYYAPPLPSMDSVGNVFEDFWDFVTGIPDHIANIKIGGKFIFRELAKTGIGRLAIRALATAPIGAAVLYGPAVASLTTTALFATPYVAAGDCFEKAFLKEALWRGVKTLEFMTGTAAASTTGAAGATLGGSAIDEEAIDLAAKSAFEEAAKDISRLLEDEAFRSVVSRLDIEQARRDFNLPSSPMGFREVLNRTERTPEIIAAKFNVTPFAAAMATNLVLCKDIYKGPEFAPLTGTRAFLPGFKAVPTDADELEAKARDREVERLKIAFPGSPEAAKFYLRKIREFEQQRDGTGSFGADPLTAEHRARISQNIQTLETLYVTKLAQEEKLKADTRKMIAEVEESKRQIEELRQRLPAMKRGATRYAPSPLWGALAAGGIVYGMFRLGQAIKS